MSRAYRLVPVRPDQRRFLGMNWKGQLYVDLALPFGLRSAPRCFTRFADVLLSIFSDVGNVTNIQHYLDDFLLAAPAASSACEDNLKECFDLCTVGQITIFLDINRIRHKMVKNAIKVGNLRRKTSLGPNFFA